MHEAFAAALSLAEEWSTRQPATWLIWTARFKAIDTVRRRAKFDASQDELARYLEAQLSSQSNVEARSNEKDHLEDALEDDCLRLIFTDGGESNLSKCWRRASGNLYAGGIVGY